jgi:RNA polymerase sigma-70 factor (ECF subfamily)
VSSSATRSFSFVGLTATQPVARAFAHTPTDPGTALLTRRLAAGEEAAFREFHAAYFDRLYQFLLVVARGQEHAAREALQETLLRVARHARAFDREEVFWCWLKAVARNAARDGGRKRTRYAAVLERFAQETTVPAPMPSMVSDHLLGGALEECLDELEALDRQVLAGKYLEGASVLELARTTGLTEKAIESRLARLRRHVRERLLKKLQSP